MGWTQVEAADKLGYMMIVNMIRAAALPGRESARRFTPAAWREFAEQLKAAARTAG